MTVVGKLYLHCVGLDLPTAFDIKYIESVENGEVGTVIQYYDITPGSKQRTLFPFVVEENKEDIEEAIKEATSYRDAAIETISSMLDNSN